MENYLNYIIESGISLGVFTLVYWFLLRKETLLKTSRFYLIAALLFSTVLPFVSIKLSLPGIIASHSQQFERGFYGSYLLETVTVFASGFPNRVGQQLLTFSPSLWIYTIGAIASLSIFVIGLVQLLLMFFDNRVFKLKRARLVLSRKAISPCSFFNLVFINSDLPMQENWKTMVHHELEHARQGHTFDVLFTDFMMVFQWFNPFYWIIRRMVRENHEFLADRAVLNRCAISEGHYKALLLSQVIGGKPIITSNFFNVQTVKKRFKMITKKSTGRFDFLKYAISIVFAVLVTSLLAIEKNNLSSSDAFVPSELEPIDNETSTELYFNYDSMQMATNKDEVVVVARDDKQISGTKDSVYQIVDEMPEFIGGEMEFRKFISKNIVYPVEAIKHKIEGRVYVSFVVAKDGAVENVKIVRSASPALDNEAVRVVSLLPKWKPGKDKGEAVSVNYTTPVNFKLQ
jgi:TonB family protein